MDPMGSFSSRVYILTLWSVTIEVLLSWNVVIVAIAINERSAKYISLDQSNSRSINHKQVFTDNIQNKIV